MTFRPISPQAGFSLIETLIALALTGCVLVAVLPLFVSALLRHEHSRARSRVTDECIARSEELLALPMGASEWQVPEGARQRSTVELWSASAGRWLPADDSAAPEVPGLWRKTLLRTFSVTALDGAEPRLEPDEALSGGETDATDLRELLLQVGIGGHPSQPAAAGHRASTRLLRAL